MSEVFSGEEPTPERGEVHAHTQEFITEAERLLFPAKDLLGTRHELSEGRYVVATRGTAADPQALSIDLIDPRTNTVAFYTYGNSFDSQAGEVRSLFAHYPRGWADQVAQKSERPDTRLGLRYTPADHKTLLTTLEEVKVFETTEGFINLMQRSLDLYHVPLEYYDELYDRQLRLDFPDGEAHFHYLIEEGGRNPNFWLTLSTEIVPHGPTRREATKRKLSNILTNGDVTYLQHREIQTLRPDRGGWWPEQVPAATPRTPENEYFELSMSCRLNEAYSIKTDRLLGRLWQAVQQKAGKAQEL